MLYDMLGYDKTGYLKYGFSKFNTDQIKSIQKGHIYVPQGDSLQERQARDVAQKLVKCLEEPERVTDIEYYSMVCDAVQRDFPDSPVEILKDVNDNPVSATHIVGNYGVKLAVIPSVLASYENVIKAVAESIASSPRVIDIIK